MPVDELPDLIGGIRWRGDVIHLLVHRVNAEIPFDVILDPITRSDPLGE
jgi:hypothetical protein